MSILNNYYFKPLWTDLKKTLTKEYFISFRFLLSMSLSSLISNFIDLSSKNYQLAVCFHCSSLIILKLVNQHRLKI